ncbi:MAG TPA: GTP 3',8-cyclase MoaA, partial [Longimicrobium sp.]|nr:GTP 3',8-cyclase MoaA [Longimicrobium sp.]
MSALVQLGGALPAVAERPVPESGPMHDGFGRRVEYLRISVTDKCNLRCVYCMPVEGLPWLKREELLSYEEIAAIVRSMAGMGLRRVRITGGEPLVRRDLATLVRLIRAVDGIDDVAVSTNAVLLDEQAEELRRAGVDRLNVSLDSLRPERIDAISRRAGSAEAIFRGLEAAERAGFAPIKINCVVMRGRNDDEVAEFAAVTRERPWHVRFIEVMPTGDNLDVSRDEYVSSDEILARVRGIGALEPVAGPPGNGPARYFAFPGAAGTVGVITP